MQACLVPSAHAHHDQGIAGTCTVVLACAHYARPSTTYQTTGTPYRYRYSTVRVLVRRYRYTVPVPRTGT